METMNYKNNATISSLPISLLSLMEVWLDLKLEVIDSRSREWEWQVEMQLMLFMEDSVQAMKIAAYQELLQIYKKLMLKQSASINKKIVSLKSLKKTGRLIRFNNSKISSSRILKDFKEAVQLQVKV